MKFRNVYLTLKDQLPWQRLIRNLVTGNIKRVFSIRAHQREDGTPKIAYSSTKSATKAANSMMKKHPSSIFKVYKCPRCDGYHIGKN